MLVSTISPRYPGSSSVVREELSKYLGNKPCDACGGARLNEQARNVFLGGHSLPSVTARPVGQAGDLLARLELPGYRGQIAERILKEINQRLQFLTDVGLDYLTLDRSADTLSGGEAQRIRLASQIGAGLVGVMYVLDEPSIGLHQRDNRRLLDTLLSLRDMGNTVIVVEHDEEAIYSADHVVDMGPGAGAHGGRIVAEGTPAVVAAIPSAGGTPRGAESPGWRHPRMGSPQRLLFTAYSRSRQAQRISWK